MSSVSEMSLLSEDISTPKMTNFQEPRRLVADTEALRRPGRWLAMKAKALSRLARRPSNEVRGSLGKGQEDGKEGKCLL